MKKILKFLNDYLEETICIILMSVMTIIIFIQVIMRYVMHNSLSWHMNIEEVSIGDAIRHAGNLLGHLHTGECNRMVPGKGRMPWREIGDALQDIKYDGNVVMEPFVRMGGQVGSDIKIWRDISRGASEAELDADAKRSVEFQRYMLDWK